MQEGLTQFDFDPSKPLPETKKDATEMVFDMIWNLERTRDADPIYLAVHQNNSLGEQFIQAIERRKSEITSSASDGQISPDDQEIIDDFDYVESELLRNIKMKRAD